VPAPIEPRDLPRVYALIGACYEQFGFRLNLDDECEQHLKDPRAYFRAHGGEFWVIRDAEGIVRATAALYLHQDRTPPLAELKSMYVDVAWRRRGVGSTLTTMVMDEARRRGCDEMELWSDTRFTPAHAMYESLGFVRIGERTIQDSNNSVEFGFRRRL
jgi:putative acetyltransferase